MQGSPDAPGFDRLLHPFDVETFLSDVIERKPLLIRREKPSYYAAILTIDDIDELLGNSGTPSRCLRVHKAGVEVSPNHWSNGPEIDVHKVGALFAEGATIIVNSANRYMRPLADFCNRVEKQLGYRVQPNIYITPAGSQGFRQHYDDHDVFIMQVQGRKTWRLYGSPVELPSRYQRHVKDGNSVSEAEASFELDEGDVLYIPRGHLHDAESTDTASTHITLGLHPVYFYEVVEEIARKARDKAGFRRAVPNFFGNAPDAEVLNKMKRMALDLVSEVDIAEILKDFERHHIEHRAAGRRVPFGDMLDLHKLTELSQIEPVDDLVYRLDQDGDKIHLRFSGSDLGFPLFMEESLRAILDGRPMAIGSIPGLLDDEDRVRLIKRLIAAGAVRKVSKNGEE